MPGIDAETGFETVVGAVTVVVVGKGKGGHGEGRDHLGKVCIVHELEALITELESEVVVGPVSDASYADVVDGHGVLALASALIGNIITLTAVAIETAPDDEVDVEVVLAQDGIGLELMAVAYCDLGLQTVNVDSLEGDDVDNGCECDTTIKGGGRSAEYLYLFDFL